MKLLVVSEGKHELGGSMETLVRRLLPLGITIVLDDVRGHVPKLHPIKGGFDYEKKALQWVMLADKRGFDAIVLLVDEDDQSERIKGFRRAQERTAPPTTLPRALGVAVHTFDAWMLADEKALSDVLSRVIQCLPAPETIRDPKSVCQQLRDETPDCELGLAEMYKSVVEKTRLEMLEQRCPSGFKPFAERVRALATTT